MQNLLSLSLLSKNIKTYRKIVFPVVLYQHETFSLILREEHTHVREHVADDIWAKHKVTGEWQYYLMGSFIIGTPHQMLFAHLNQEELDGWVWCYI
jgi:hypothetical protein